MPEHAPFAARRIGKSELSVAPLILGANVLGWTVDAAASFEILDHFVASGFDMIDTADIYSQWVPGHEGGESEAIIGAWLRSRGGRDRVKIATKIGARPRPGAQAADVWDANLTAAHLVQAVEGSLRRLQTDYIDLCQSHLDDAATPLDETLEAYSRLVASGKIRVIGASHYSVPRLDTALAISEDRGWPRYESLQLRYNLCDRKEFEGGYQDFCSDRNVGALCYSALAKGFLTGGYRDEAAVDRSPWAARLQAYADPRGIRILEALEEVAGEQEESMAAIALAWVLAQQGVAAVIAAVSDIGELADLRAAPAIALETAQIERLRMAASISSSKT